MKLDLSQDKLGCTLPDELAHLEEYAKYAKPIKTIEYETEEGEIIEKAEVYGFFIRQWKEDGTPNQDWYSFRRYTIGASSIATLLDLEEYGDTVKLFRSKVDYDAPFFYSKFTSNGLHFEDAISDYWTYHDGTEEGYAENRALGKRIRHKEEIPCYAININYPHLSASLDFLVPGGQASPFTGEIIDFDFPLEVKMISPFAAEKYELGLPTRYIAQVQQQMFIMGVTYSEIVFFSGGVDLKVLPIELDVELCQDIIVKSFDFWNRVTSARDVMYTESDPLEMDKEITALEPEPSGNEAFLEFYKDKYKVSYEATERLGTEEEWDLSVKYKTLGDTIKELEKEKKETEHKIKSLTRYEEIISFGEDKGRIINKRPEGKRPTFRVNIKNYEE